MVSKTKYYLSGYFLRILPFLLVIITNLFTLLYNGETILYLLRSTFMSVVIIYFFFFILLFITKSMKKSNIILIITMFILSIVNQVKIFYMDEPIYLSDFLLLGGIKDIISITNNTLINFFYSYWFLILVHLIITILLCILIKKCYEIKRKRNLIYLFIFIVFVGISLPLKKTTYYMKKYIDYLNNFNNNCVTNGYLYYHGLIGSLYVNMIDSRIFEPSNYNSKELDKIIISNEEINNELDMNIVLLFSESFFDITKVSEIEFSYDILSDYHELSKNNKLIQMVSPSYGGISGNVEFQLLTGANLAYYSKNYIPYLSLIDSKFTKDGNLVSFLNNNFKTEVFTVCSDELFNVGKVYEYLGFNEKIKFDGTINDTKGYYVSDKYVTDKVINLLKEDNLNKFIFATTMQSHMPYTKDKYDNYSIALKTNNFDTIDQDVILSYSEGIHDASIELKRLNDYIQTLNKKTVVIFIGDHLPYLSNIDGKNLIDTLDYFNTNDILLNTYRKYNTEALIFTNFDIEFDNTNYLGVDLLIPYVLKNIGVNLPSYYNYLVNESLILPSYNRYIAVNNEGKIFDTNKLDSKLLNIYKTREALQYKLYFDK